MKKMIISLALCLSALVVSARDYSYPVGYYRLQSNHWSRIQLRGQGSGSLDPYWPCRYRSIGIHFIYLP